MRLPERATRRTRPYPVWTAAILSSTFAQRLVFNYVWELPGKNLHGFVGAVLGGWSYNGIWAFQNGAHWEPYRALAAKLREISDNVPCLASAADVNAGNCVNLGGDYNLDHGRNDRPNSTLDQFSPSRDQWKNGWGGVAVASTFSSPCLGCTGNLGRNTFEGPGLFTADMTLGKVFKFTERVNMKFDAQAFNIFNRANFLLATQGGGAHNTITERQFRTGCRHSERSQPATWIEAELLISLLFAGPVSVPWEQAPYFFR